MLNGTDTELREEDVQTLSGIFKKAGYSFSPEDGILKNSEGKAQKISVEAQLLDDGCVTVGHIVYTRLPESFNGKADNMCILICSDSGFGSDTQEQVKAKLDKAFTP
jgi:hypothetical protein